MKDRCKIKLRDKTFFDSEHAYGPYHKAACETLNGLVQNFDANQTQKAGFGKSLNTAATKKSTGNKKIDRRSARMFFLKSLYPM